MARQLIGRSRIVDQFADQMDERLLFGSSLASPEKVSKLDLCLRSTRRDICLVQDKNAFSIIATQQPSVAVFAFINLSLIIGHFPTSADEPMVAGYVPCTGLPSEGTTFDYPGAVGGGVGCVKKLGNVGDRLRWRERFD